MTLHKPKKNTVKSLVTLEKTSSSLIINIPPLRKIKVSDDKNIYLSLLGLLLLITFFINISHSLYSGLLRIFVSFSILFLCFKLNYQTQIKINKNEFLIDWNSWIFSRKNRGKIADISKINCERNYNYEKCHIVFHLFTGKKKHKFGYYLSQKEQQWLVAEIRNFLEQLKFQESLKKSEEKLLD